MPGRFAGHRAIHARRVCPTAQTRWRRRLYKPLRHGPRRFHDFGQNDVKIEENIDALERRISLAESERDALQLAGQEENYLRAYSLVEALELQLEEQLRRVQARDIR